MAYISREDYFKQQAERQERANFTSKSNGVGYLKLANDGDEAIVRFVYTDPDQFDILTVHDTKVNGKFRRVNCLRESFKDSPDSCPFCAAGEKPKNRFYIKLIEYTEDENGKIVAQPKIWDTSTSYVTVLNNLFTEFNNISDYVFKIKRNGRAGDTNTSYMILPTNSNVYTEEHYPKNNDAFKDYRVLGSAVLDMSYDELANMVGGTSDVVSPTPAPTFAPVEHTTAPRKPSYN